MHWLEGTGGAASGPGWHCIDCAPAAVLARTLFRGEPAGWPEPAPSDRCESCGVTRLDVVAELATAAR